jgi:hypothetical protein
MQKSIRINSHPARYFYDDLIRVASFSSGSFNMKRSPQYGGHNEGREQRRK